MHSHTVSLTPDSYFLESWKRIWDKAGGLITNNISELYQWLADFSLQHLSWNCFLKTYSNMALEYINIWHSKTGLASIHCSLHKASSKSCVFRGIYSREVTWRKTEINWEVSENQKKYVDNLWVIAEKPLQKKKKQPEKVITKVWQYLRHPEEIKFEYFEGQICSITSDITIPSQRVGLTC